MTKTAQNPYPLGPHIFIWLWLEYGETLKFLYIKYQPILVKSYQRFTKFNYDVTRTIYES